MIALYPSQSILSLIVHWHFYHIMYCMQFGTLLFVWLNSLKGIFSSKANTSSSFSWTSLFSYKGPLWNHFLHQYIKYCWRIFTAWVYAAWLKLQQTAFWLHLEVFWSVGRQSGREVVWSVTSPHLSRPALQHDRNPSGLQWGPALLTCASCILGWQINIGTWFLLTSLWLSDHPHHPYHNMQCLCCCMTEDGGG